LEIRPEAGDLPTDAATEGGARVEDGSSEDERRGRSLGLGEEARDVVERMLTVCVDLEGVGVAEGASHLEARLHRGALAAVVEAVVDVREPLGLERHRRLSPLGLAAV